MVTQSNSSITLQVRFGEQAERPPEFNLKQKHWDPKQQAARCEGILRRQLQDAAKAAGRQASIPDVGMMSEKVSTVVWGRGWGWGGGAEELTEGNGQSGEGEAEGVCPTTSRDPRRLTAEPMSAMFDSVPLIQDAALRLQLIDGYRKSRQQPGNAGQAKGPRGPATLQSLKALVSASGANVAT